MVKELEESVAAACWVESVLHSLILPPCALYLIFFFLLSLLSLECLLILVLNFLSFNRKFCPNSLWCLILGISLKYGRETSEWVEKKTC